MTLKGIPDHQNFATGNALYYRDGNNNNNAILTVTSVIGPTKYAITQTAQKPTHYKAKFMWT
jgi:hypothetical protein